MRKLFYSLRTGILANLILLILSAMLLINAVTVRLAENDLIRSRTQEGTILANALSQWLGRQIADHGINETLPVHTPFKKEIEKLLGKGSFSEMLFIPASGQGEWALGPWKQGKEEAIALCHQALVTEKGSNAFYGSTWAVIWLGYENVKISMPVRSQGRTVGALTVCSHLTDLYGHLRQSEKIILIYILLNTIILLAAGMYLLSRTVVKPIHKLLKVTQQFKGGEPLPFPTESSRNEIGQLFHSLKMMLNRLEENKKELQTHIASLQEANEQLRKTQEEVIRSEKLASVGRLAAGIAHEIGNPVGIVLGYIDLIKNGELSAEEVRDSLVRCESEINRINTIIRQLLDFSRPSTGAPQPIKIHDLLVETIEMLKPQPLMKGIIIEQDFRSPDDTVLGDPGYLKQVFVNIILNAADAIEEKRKTNEQHTDHRLSIMTQNGRNTITVQFSDTGCGIASEAIERIFDPFYSTKEPGKGTGLGLSVSYRIIEQMGGTIRAESSYGEGTTVSVCLPLLSKTKKDQAGESNA